MIRPCGVSTDEAYWRRDAELVFELEQVYSVGYRNFYYYYADD